MICVNNADDIMLDEKTIYNYIDAGLLSVDNVDLPRKVRYRTRSHKKPVRVDKQCHVGRTYEEFEAYLAANLDIPVVEMDSVEGRKGGKVLLTIYFRNSSLKVSFAYSRFLGYEKGPDGTIVVVPENLPNAASRHPAARISGTSQRCRVFLLMKNTRVMRFCRNPTQSIF